MDMKKKTLKHPVAHLSLVLGLALALPVVAGAQKPQKPPKGPGQLTIAAKPNVVTFGRSTTVSGQLAGVPNAGVGVTLEEDAYAFGAFKPLLTKTTDANGAYSFLVVPKLNVKYRAVAKTSPRTTSAEALVLVRIRVGLRLSDSTPRRGQLVRFSGTATPAHDGRLVSIQRRTTSGSYRTVARTPLLDAGATRSRFRRRIRISRDGVYRARVTADADHATGTSGHRRARVG